VGESIAPFLRARQAWSVGTTRVPDISFYHGRAAQYAATARSAKPFVRSNPSYEATCDGLRRLHLSFELVTDEHLAQGEIRSSLLLLEDTPKLSAEDQGALRRYVEGGGRVLLTGRARASSGLLSPAQLASTAERLDHTVGRGKVFNVPQPLFPAGATPWAAADTLLAELIPAATRRVLVEGGNEVGVLLRRRGDSLVLHFVNHAAGERERDPQAGEWNNLHVKSLPSAPACTVSVMLPRPPQKLTFVPSGAAPAQWSYRDGRLRVSAPAFAVHQLLVID
jgi:hypothetical protein